METPSTRTGFRRWPWLLLAVALGASAGELPAKRWLELAQNYENGRGLPRNQQKAFRLYCMAARGGASEAFYSLGWMYFSGRGVPRDMERAAHWFARGAEAGDRVAANMLRRLGQAAASEEDPRCPPLLTGRALTRKNVEGWVRLLAPEYGLDAELVIALIEVESNFNPRARSSKGALGLMQLMPETAKRFGVEDALDPMQNLQGGMAYLRWLLDYFDGNIPLALAGYNAGEGAVDRYQGVPPYRETRDYVKRITRNLEKTALTESRRPATRGS